MPCLQREQSPCDVGSQEQCFILLVTCVREKQVEPKVLMEGPGRPCHGSASVRARKPIYAAVWLHISCYQAHDLSVCPTFLLAYQPFCILSQSCTRESPMPVMCHFLYLQAILSLFCHSARCQVQYIHRESIDSSVSGDIPDLSPQYRGSCALPAWYMTTRLSWATNLALTQSLPFSSCFHPRCRGWRDGSMPWNHPPHHPRATVLLCCPALLFCKW